MSHNIILTLISTTETMVRVINCGLRISVQCFQHTFHQFNKYFCSLPHRDPLLKMLRTSSYPGIII